MSNRTDKLSPELITITSGQHELCIHRDITLAPEQRTKYVISMADDVLMARLRGEFPRKCLVRLWRSIRMELFPAAQAPWHAIMDAYATVAAGKNTRVDGPTFIVEKGSGAYISIRIFGALSAGDMQDEH